MGYLIHAIKLANSNQEIFDVTEKNNSFKSNNDKETNRGASIGTIQKKKLGFREQKKGKLPINNPEIQENSSIFQDIKRDRLFCRKKKQFVPLNYVFSQQQQQIEQKILFIDIMDFFTTKTETVEKRIFIIDSNYLNIIPITKNPLVSKISLNLNKIEKITISKYIGEKEQSQKLQKERQEKWKMNSEYKIEIKIRDQGYIFSEKDNIQVLEFSKISENTINPNKKHFSTDEISPQAHSAKRSISSIIVDSYQSKINKTTSNDISEFDEMEEFYSINNGSCKNEKDKNYYFDENPIEQGENIFLKLENIDVQLYFQHPLPLLPENDSGSKKVLKIVEEMERSEKILSILQKDLTNFDAIEDDLDIFFQMNSGVKGKMILERIIDRLIFEVSLLGLDVAQGYSDFNDCYECNVDRKSLVSSNLDLTNKQITTNFFRKMDQNDKNANLVQKNNSNNYNNNFQKNIKSHNIEKARQITKTFSKKIVKLRSKSMKSKIKKVSTKINSPKINKKKN
ncbi:hypothetical protein M0813_08647 [Anaeramoeba flamelloides]|uniref:DUF4378 domain-containing protein n=1 Tax=Anaeramoeba flamelloides TaxID=1746091 RepID=A0ABQ8X7G7_9EUKA|nr:hypothetical protein M0813_08647 [Anaeramoeba flamelloides]